jgi:DNA-binding GntR family transcriptional regulator
MHIAQFLYDSVSIYCNTENDMESIQVQSRIELGKRDVTLSDEVFLTLSKAIISGEIPPGQRLDEPSVCRRFGVSRTPVREALRRLEGTGLVEVIPRRGVMVSQISVEGLTDMFDALGEFEGLCARLSAERMTPLERRRLQVLNETLMKNATKRGAPLRDYNEQFHELIYQGAHNECVAGVTRGFRHRVAPFQVLQFAPRASPESFQDHDLIVRAITAGDAVGAQRTMRDHITHSSLQVIDHFAQRLQQPGGGVPAIGRRGDAVRKR